MNDEEICCLNKAIRASNRLKQEEQLSSPHPLLRASSNINWFRDRSTKKMIERSLNDYYVSSKESNIIIKPKYLFSQSTFDKIAKLKYLFGQFDKDKSRTLELKEIQQMFKENKIPMEMKNIISLFTSSDGKETQFDFNSLVNYAISNRTDEKYRTQMRSLKNKIGESKTNRDLYIPMDFNSLLEYFNSKGKIRDRINDVSAIIGKMENITKTDKEFHKSLNLHEKENKIHNEISYSTAVDNFEDIIKISSRNLDQFNINRNTINKIGASSKETNLSSLPMIESTNYTNSMNDLHYDNYCPSKIISLCNISHGKKEKYPSKKTGQRIINLKKIRFDNNFRVVKNNLINNIKQ